MSFALQPTSLIPVQVTKDWTVAANFTADVVKSLEESFPGVFQFPAGSALTLTLVQVQSGKTYKGTLSVAADTGVGTITGAVGSVPAVGSEVYLIDMY